MDKILLRPAEAAELLGVSRSKVYQLLAVGTLPRVRVGLSLRIPTKALQRWVERQLEEAGHPARAARGEFSEAAAVPGRMDTTR
jgi:excisionase family DNA binding protein